MDRTPSKGEDVTKMLNAEGVDAANLSFAGDEGPDDLVGRRGCSPARADTGQDIDETYWTDLDDQLVTNYMRAKIVAEQAAWAVIGEQSSATQLTTILPGANFGPFMDGRNSSTDLLFSQDPARHPQPESQLPRRRRARPHGGSGDRNRALHSRGCRSGGRVGRWVGVEVFR